MLLKLFKSNHPYVLFLIPVLGLVLWIPVLFGVPLTFDSVNLGTPTFLFNWVNKLLSFHPMASYYFALVLLIIESYVLIRLNFKYIFIETKTYLPAVFFVVLSSVLVVYQQLHPLLIANLFILLAINKAFVFEKDRNQFKRYFESGIFLGLGTLFYPNAYLFILIIWMTLLVLRNFNWREWFSTILGLVTPAVFYFVILYLSGNWNSLFLKFTSNLFAQAGNISFSVFSLVAFSLLTLISLIAALAGLRIVGLKKISQRKYYTLFFWMLIFTILLFILPLSVGYELVVVVAIPLSIILSILFVEIRSKWLSEVLFTFILLLVFVIIWLH